MKWIKTLTLLALVSAALTPAWTQTEPQFQLTNEEQAWLEAHPRIRLAPAPNFPPLEFFDEQGVYRGVMADYTAILEARLGIEFEIVQYDNWQDVVTDTKAHEVDVWMEAQDSKERRAFMHLTRPYVNLPVVIIVRDDTTGTLELSDLKDRKVAVIDGYVSSDFVRNNYPELQLVPVPSIEVGLARVSFRTADALVANIGTASYYIEKCGISNLRVAGNSGFEWNLCVATRKDWPELHNLLQRALDSIEPSQRQQIYRRWISLEQQSLLATREFWISLLAGVGVVLLIIAAILIWNRALSRQVAKGVEKLAKETATRARMQRDLDIARSVQQGLLPEESPKIEHFDIAGWSQPADETGGDYYDWQLLSNGRLAISLADVTGHGIGPALVTAVCRAYSRASFPSGHELGAAMDHINELLFEDLPVERFVTFVVALLDPEESSVELLSAGHGPLFLYTAADNLLQNFKAHNIPLGLAPGIEYGPPQQIRMMHGDMLVLLTDGFFEWMNADGQQFGLDRLQQAILDAKDLPAEEIISDLYSRVRQFAGDELQQDDLTIVIVKRKASEEIA